MTASHKFGQVSASVLTTLALRFPVILNQFLASKSSPVISDSGNGLISCYHGKTLSTCRRHDKGAEESAHGLKGGAANIGATEMATLCEQLETQGELGSIGDAPEVMKKLVRSWSTVKTQITQYHQALLRANGRDMITDDVSDSI